MAAIAPGAAAPAGLQALGAYYYRAGIAAADAAASAAGGGGVVRPAAPVPYYVGGQGPEAVAAAQARGPAYVFEPP